MTNNFNKKTCLYPCSNLLSQLSLTTNISAIDAEAPTKQNSPIYIFSTPEIPKKTNY